MKQTPPLVLGALLSASAALAQPGAIAEGPAPDPSQTPPHRSQQPALRIPSDGSKRELSLTIPTLHALGLFTTLRVTEAVLYPDPFAETRLDVIGDHYLQALTRPPKFDPSQPVFEWDGDPWYINVVGHAAMGSQLYLRARTCGFSVVEGLLFTGAGAAVWDYAFEASGVPPSTFDLWYTPLSGALLGEFRYFVWQRAASIQQPFWRGFVRGVFDPFGELERLAGTRC